MVATTPRCGHDRAAEHLDVQRAKLATFEANNVSAETRSFTQQQADALQ